MPVNILTTEFSAVVVMVPWFVAFADFCGANPPPRLLNAEIEEMPEHVRQYLTPQDGISMVQTQYM